MPSFFESVIGGATGGATVAIIIKAYDEYSKELSRASGAASSSSKIMTASFAATAAAAVAVGAAITSLAIEAGKAEGIARSFSHMYGTVAPQALDELKEATNGTVSQMELMAAANQALLLGIDPNALPEMFKGAYAVSQATGRPVAQSIEDISLGIARQSKLILDNLGIIVDVEKANQDYAYSLGKTSDALTDAERKIAFTNAAMEALRVNTEKVGPPLENAATKTQQVMANWANFKVEIGQLFAPIINAGLEALNAELEGLNEFFGAIGEAFVSEEEHMQRIVENNKKLNPVIDEKLQTETAIAEAIQAQNAALTKQISLYDKIRAGSSYLSGASDKEIAIAIGGKKPIGSNIKLNDFVMRPGSPPVSFSSEDTLIGVKDTTKLSGGKTVNIFIESVQGLNPEAVANALKKQVLNSIVS